MKPTSLLFILCAISHSYIFAQSKHFSFIEEGKTWTYEVSNPNSAPEYNANWTKTYQLDGDTLINSFHCAKVYATCTQPNWKYDRLYVGALFEDSGNTFFFWQKSQTPHLLYDFSCKKGDTVVIDNREIIIQEKLSTSYGVDSLDIFRWSYNGFDGYWSLWVEGVGCPYNDLLDYAYDSDPGGYQYKLLSCRIKGTEIFNYDTFQTEITSVTSPSSLSPTSPSLTPWYTLSGRCLPSLPTQKGIYIKDGRKVLIK